LRTVAIATRRTRTSYNAAFAPRETVMSTTAFHVVAIDWSNAHDRDACRAVREAVFVIEQHVPIEDEWDEFDAISQHVLARDAHGEAIGTGRLVPPQTSAPARIGRMAVRGPWRGRHVGAALLHALVERARTLGYVTLEMHAQTHALAFYARHGFAVCGNEFLECGIAHRPMRRHLDAE